MVVSGPLVVAPRGQGWSKHSEDHSMRKKKSPQEIVESKVGRMWRLWWISGHSDRWLDNVQPLVCRDPRLSDVFETRVLLF